MDSSTRRACSALALLALVGVSILPSRVWAEPRSGSSNICIFDHTALRSPAGTCRPQAIVYPKHVVGRVQRAIYDSAMTFGVPYAILLRIARCESSLNPRAENGNHFGLFQFLPATFTAGLRGMRAMTGIQARSYWNPRDASYVAGFLFADGKATSWSCLSQAPS